MKRIIEAIKKDLVIKNYYSALYVALSLIDACTKIEFTNSGKKEYIRWLTTYFLPLYEPDPENAMVPAPAIYQLRCSVLHESSLLINKKNRIKDPEIAHLYQIIFTTTGSHRNASTISNGTERKYEIQLDVNMFINEIIKSIEKWMETKDVNDYMLHFSIENDRWSSSDVDGNYGFKDCK